MSIFTTVSAAGVESNGIDGRMMRPVDIAYNEARRVFDAMSEGRPALIAAYDLFRTNQNIQPRA
jgi:hypothetical protein